MAGNLIAERDRPDRRRRNAVPPFCPARARWLECRRAAHIRPVCVLVRAGRGGLPRARRV